ncbi:23S rRNA (guanosine(2251)-2'-O)-methyltransferase RlmB [Stagnimonas aquatica]|uniref:23S rRNA (guanosine-2'-O-)-methyltransferase RlmB n=1 Tax=Stagnimonas aquatica TaxID=2689987 RepID=A0A3N0V565_9GAMM|nr:23S rRNA (guanosine(2251)-2'-O)-methyltransferase RlmB [Stagnimonas aquatica]ROH87853.1 23S rRNA (guanosine(2251)-2'-O)-methyltransferase RlmB [Stagnimonas aquatica]
MSETYIGGFHAVTAALEDGEKQPREILVADARRDSRMAALLSLAARRKVTVRTVSKDQLDLYAPGLRHQGVIAAVPAADFQGEDALEVPATPDRLVLVLDGVQDPHNLGACLRTAEAVGVTAVIIPKDRAVGLTPVARKAAAGAAERVPVVAVTNLTRALERLKELGYWITGLAGEADELLYQADLTGPTVIVMGGEGDGLRRLTRETCDKLVRIPMVGEIESLNVSVAAAVCLYESFRQRQAAVAKTKKPPARRK